MSMGSVPAAPIDTGVYISAPLGGGHVTAKNGVMARQKKESEAVGHRFETAKDIDITKLSNIGFLKFGDWTAKAWNDAQKKGDLGTLRRMTMPICMRVAEFFLGWLVCIRLKAMLRNLTEPPKHVVSTQAFCLKAIAQAVQDVNKEKDWHMHLDVYLTDLPSKRATHFFPSVKRVADDEELRKITTLHAPKPIEKSTRTEEQFWEKYCGKIHVVTTDPFPIRATFLDTEKLGRQLQSPTLDIPIRLNNPQELEGIQKGMGSLNRVNTENREKLYQIRIKTTDKVGFLMLGSQPTKDAVISWLKTFVRAGEQQALHGDREQYFFLYCGTPDKGMDKNPLLAAVNAEIAKMRSEGHLSEKMHIIPFTNQEADVIAPLMARSDMTITRSGGATTMELLQIHQSSHIPKRENRCTFIHSEALIRPDDVHILNTLEKRLGDLIKEGSPLSEGVLTFIQNEMLHACRLMGIPRAERTKVVQEILSREQLLIKNSPQLISSLMSSLTQEASHLSKEAVSREKKIHSKMEMLKEKDKYARMPEPELKHAAIEKLLIQEGIILWEGKNARYLQAKVEGTSVVNPEYAESYLRGRFFQ